MHWFLYYRDLCQEGVNIFHATGPSLLLLKNIRKKACGFQMFSGGTERDQ